MPDQEVKYTVKIEKAGTGAGDAANDLKKVETQAKATTAEMGGLTKGFGALFAALGGLHLINKSVNAFLEQERAVGKLNAALKSVGEATPEITEQMKKLAGSLADVSLFGDEAILNLIAKLIALNGGTQNVKQLATAVLDLSTLMDKDLNRAAAAMGQALQGEFGAFKQLGIQIDDTLKPSERFIQMQQGITKIAGGQAKAAVETLGGHYEQLKKQAGELTEAFGGLVLATVGPLDQVTARLKAMGEWMEENRSTLAEILTWGGMAQAGPNAVPAKAKAKIDFEALGMPAVAAASAGANQFQFLPRHEGPPPPPIPPGVAKADHEWEQAQTENALKGIAERMRAQLKADDEVAKAREKQAEEEDKRGLAEMDIARRVASAEIELEQEVTLAGLDGAERERAQIDINHERRKAQIREMEFLNEDSYNHLIALADQLHEKEKANQAAQRGGLEQLGNDLAGIAGRARELFADGLATAIIDAFEGGEQAFKKFAATFLREISHLILKALIFRAIGSLFGGSTAAANGGQFTAMAGGGMAETNGPVVMPRFGVLAGEAGRELLTVMAQPRLANINGLSARVGNVGGRAMAITDANALSRGGGGAGGMVNINVHLAPGLRAEIVRDSVRGAQVQITQDLGQDTPVSRGVKRVAT